jgi:hypothetical protein
MPYFTPDDLDIDVDDFLSSCSSSEIEQVIDYLIEDGRITPERKFSQLRERGLSVGESFYVEAIENLADKYHMLTKEEEELIIKLSKRF